MQDSSFAWMLPSTADSAGSSDASGTLAFKHLTRAQELSRAALPTVAVPPPGTSVMIGVDAGMPLMATTSAPASPFSVFNAGPTDLSRFRFHKSLSTSTGGMNSAPAQLPNTAPAAFGLPQFQLAGARAPGFTHDGTHGLFEPLPPLLATPEELSFLEPRSLPVFNDPAAAARAPSALLELLATMAPPLPAAPPLAAPPGVCLTTEATSGNTARALPTSPSHSHRRTVSSPPVWDPVTMGAPPVMPPGGGSGSNAPSAPNSSVAVGPGSKQDMQPAPPYAGAGPSSSTTLSTEQPADRKAVKRSNSGHTNTTPSQAGAGSSGANTLGATATSSGPAIVQDLLAELPPVLQPIVAAKVSVRGRGGRQPAADPMAMDPNMDPKKARRILANRQSAARSKMKQRVMMETLRANKELLAAAQDNVQHQVGALQAQLDALATRNAELEVQNRELTARLQALTTHIASQPGSSAGGASTSTWMAASGLPTPREDGSLPDPTDWWVPLPNVTETVEMDL